MKNLRVLLIDDDVVDRKMVTRMLKQAWETVQISEAGDAETAYRLINQGDAEYDCIFIDYFLPDENGLEIIKNLTAQSKYAFTPVILLTGQKDERLAVQAIRSGAVDYVVKGTLSAEELYQIVRSALRFAAQERQLAEMKERAMRTEKLAILGTMAAGIAHEINQPLNTIKLIADGILHWHRRGKQVEQERLVENMDKVSRQVDRIGQIIKHMRAFISHEEVVNLEWCNVSKAIDGAMDLVGSQIRSHGIALHRNQEQEKALPFVVGTMSGLEVIIINLLINAIQALDGTDTEAKEIYILSSYNEKEVFLEISDNGPGVSTESSTHIFEPFFTTKLTGGLGLGLYIVHNMVNHFGGSISLLEKPGGAHFRLTFPIAREEAR